MARLILTTSDSGAGHFKSEAVAQRVIAVTHRLVWGAVPVVEDEADFLVARRELARAPGEDWRIGANDAIEYGAGMRQEPALR